MSNQQLVDYIKQQLQQGINKEEIKNTLFANGWQIIDIEEAFKAIDNQQKSYSDLLYNNSQSQNSVIQATKKTSKIIWIIVILALIIGTGVAGYFFIAEKKQPLVNNVQTNEENLKESSVEFSEQKAQDELTIPFDWQVYKGEFFEFSHPKTWQIEDERSSFVVFKDPQFGYSNNGFIVFLISFYPNKNNLSLDEWWAQEGKKSENSSYKKTDTVNIAGFNAYKLTLTNSETIRYIFVTTGKENSYIFDIAVTSLDQKTINQVLSTFKLSASSLSPQPDKDNKITVALKYGTIKISLSSNWIQATGAQLEQLKNVLGTSDLGIFLRTETSSLLSIEIKDLTAMPCNSNSSPMDLLKQLESARKTQAGLIGLKISSDYSTIFGLPLLIMTSNNSTTKEKLRESSFVKNCKLYTIAFSCKETNFEKEWPAIEQSIKTIEFIK